MKTILSLLFTLLTVFTFDCTVGEGKSEVTISVSKNGSNQQIVTTTGYMKTWQTMDMNYHTLDWRLVNMSESTDVTITRKGTTYHIEGMFKGKKVVRDVESKGRIWVQHVGYASGHLIDGKDRYTYECFSPKDLDIYEMQVTRGGCCQVNGRDAFMVKNSAVGVKSAFWHCNYSYDCATLDLVAYKAVEGGPGTPETKWVIKSKK